MNLFETKLIAYVLGTTKASEVTVQGFIILLQYTPGFRVEEFRNKVQAFRNSNEDGIE
jgi:hypothetical protein